MAILNNVAELIGNTPMVRLRRIPREVRAEIVVKLEYLCPVGGVKGRVALAMLEAAERAGKLVPGMIVLEATSGSTGIALAMVCSVKGYRCMLVMPETMSQERKVLLRALGAELVLTPGAVGLPGAICQAEQIASEMPGRYFIPQQFNNPENSAAQRATGEEIWRDTDGRCDIFVAGVGTGGTITGVGEVIKAYKPTCRVIAVEPSASAVLTGNARGAHAIQGIGAGFIPATLNPHIYDEVVTVEDADAMHMTRRLALEESIFAGISTGAHVWAALQVASRPENEGKMVVTVACSPGERYLSTATYSPYA